METRGLSPSSRRDSSPGTWTARLEQFVIPNRFVCDRHLHHPVEQHAAATRGSSVEAEDELVEIAGQVRAIHRPLVGAEQPALRQRSDTVNAREQVSGVFSLYSSRSLAMAFVRVAMLRDPAVAAPAVGDDNSPRFDVLLNERPQTCGSGVIEGRHPAPTEPSTRTCLDRNASQDLLPLGAAAR